MMRTPHALARRASIVSAVSVACTRTHLHAPIRPVFLACQQPRRALSGRITEARSKGVAQSEGPEHVLVIGGGALGSLFAGRLGALKTLQDRVWMLTSWEEQAQAVAENKAVIVQEEGNVGSKCLIGQVQVARSLPEVREMQVDTLNSVHRGRVNVVFIAVKQPHARKAAEQAGQIMAGVHGGVCITLLNGLGHIELFRNSFRNNDVFGTLIHGVFTGGAHIETPGVVQHAGQGRLSLAIIGDTPDPLSQHLLEQVRETIEASGIETQFVKHVQPLAWEKLCVNVAINALTGLLRVSNGKILESHDCCHIMKDAVKEAHAVACKVLLRDMGEDEASKCPFVADGWEKMVDKAVCVAQRTADNRSSMLADVESLRDTEVESIYGSVVREGQMEGVPTPTNLMLLRLIRAHTELHKEKEEEDEDDSWIEEWDRKYGNTAEPGPIPFSS